MELDGCALTPVVDLLCLSDDILLHVLYHAGPNSALRECNSLLAHLGRNEILWQSFCESIGLIQPSPTEGTGSWLVAYKRAVQCSHQRGARCFDYSVAKPAFESYAWFSEEVHTACACAACGRKFTMVVAPHHDPNAGGLRMCHIDFGSIGGESWSELWYYVANKLYSLRGGEFERLEDAKTHVVCEMPVARPGAEQVD